MRKLFKTAIFTLSACALPLSLAATVNADSLIKDSIDTTLEYQVNSAGDSIRFISTMVLNDSKTLDDITKIDMDFKLTKDGETDKDSDTITKTTVYEAISGANGKDKVDNTYYSVLTITDLTTSFTGWRITPKFTYTYADASTEEVTASPWLIGGTRIYFTNSYNWDSVYAFAYKDGVSSNGSWPGQQMTLFDSDHGVYYIDYLKTEAYDSIIFNTNNNRQTEDLAISDSIHSYSLGRMNGDGKYEGLGSTCSTHKWSSDYENNGANHYHVCEVCGAKSKITDNDMEPVDGEPGVYKDVYSQYKGEKVSGRIYFEDSYYWGANIYLHHWNGTSPSDWPGDEMHYFTTNMWGKNIFYADTLGDCQNIIFHNNNGSQTQNGSVSPTGNAYYLGNDSYIGGAYNICETSA